MSLQEYEELITELEGQNEDLRYRLSFSSSEQDNLTSGIRELMSENEQLVHRVMNLEQALKAERENSISREHSLRRALKEKNIIIEELEMGPGSRMSLNSSTSELEDDTEKRKLHALEQDITARDMLIEELEVTVEDLHKQYHNTRVEGDIAMYELSENTKLIEEKLAHAELMSQDEGMKYSELSDKYSGLEEMYEGLCERYNEQLALAEGLSEKLTLTEFDLFAAAERLDDITHDVAQTHDAGTSTEITVSVDIEKLKLEGELERLGEKYEESVYRVSELTMDNSTLESKIVEVENELDHYLNQDSVNSSRGSSSIDHLLVKKEEALHNLTIKLEEFQNEKLKRENELLEKLNELTENKHALCERLEAYEDEIFELSEQIAIIETEKEDTEKDDKLAAISRKLSSLQGLLSLKEDRGEGSSGESDLDSNGNEVLRASTQDLAVARDRAAELERELEQSSADNELFKQKISELEKRVAELESVQQDNLEKLDDRKSEIDSLKREINRLKTIEEQHERMKAEQAKASEATARTTEIAGLQATILNKNSEIETLKARVVDYEASSDISKKCLKTLQDNIETMEAEKNVNGGLKEQESLSHQVNIKTLEAAVEQGKSESEALESSFNAKLNAEVQRMGEVQNLVQQELEGKMAELNTLRAQVEGGDPEMDKLRANNEEFKQALAMREVDLAALTTKLSSVEAELSLTKDSNREGEVREVELELKMDELAAISAEMDTAAQEEINQLNVLITQHSESIAAKDTALATAEDNKAKLEILLSTALAEQAQLHSSASGLEERIRAELAKLGGELKESEAEVTARREEVTMYEAQCEKLDSRVRESEALCKELQATVEGYEQESKTRGADSNLELLYLQNDVKAHLVKIEQLKQELVSQSKEHELVTESYNTQSQQLEALRKDVSQQLDTIEELEHSVQDATERAQQSNTKYLLSDAERADLVTELAQSQATLQSQIEKIEGLTADLAKLTADKEESDAQLTATQGQLTATQGQLVEAEGQLAEAEGQLTATQGQLTATQGQLTATQGQLTATQGQLAEAEGQLVVAKGQLAEAEGQLAEAEGQLVEAEGQLTATQGQLTATQGQLVEAEGQLVEAEGQLAEAEGQLTATQGQLSATQGQLVEAEGQLAEAEGQLTATQGQFSVDNCVNYEMIEKGDVEGLGDLVVVQRETVQSLGNSLAEVNLKSERVERLEKELEKLTADLEASVREGEKIQKEYNMLSKERDELDSKAGVKDKQGEKEVTELKGQLNKMTKEAEKNMRENKKTQEKLLDTKASLAELQLKLSKVAEEKRVEKAMPAAPVTVIESPKNTSECKDRDLISKLEKQLSSLQSEKDKVHSEITSAQWQKQMAVAGGLAGAGVASAVAYLTALYSC